VSLLTFLWKAAGWGNPLHLKPDHQEGYPKLSLKK
jgi:hypothetical protein